MSILDRVRPTGRGGTCLLASSFQFEVPYSRSDFGQICRFDIHWIPDTKFADGQERRAGELAACGAAVATLSSS